MALSSINIEKVGNTLIYLRQSLSFLSKTKALKLLYLIEEQAVAKFGHQILNLDFEVWKHGPVDRQLYYELSNSELNLLKPYIQIENFQSGKSIQAKAAFNDDEFSTSDLKLIDEVIKNFGHLNANELIEITHREGSPWHNQARKHNKFFWLFNNTTDELIDLSQVISTDNNKKQHFKEHQEFINLALDLNK
ncbi:Panacea domain-containing protein [uncultured Roseivirga sp.]|uniref:Panacea domain-containing protein n=1 Tax=uncultured Roseivirga sp. TaxID=543088 RepID=UPI0030D799CB|tara:strand:- start:1744 stop:2319 length:576 start_codon:yes stop_codon:yes gene_type:complete